MGGAGGSRDLPQVMQPISGCLSPCCKFWDPKTQVQIHHTFPLSSAPLTNHLVTCSLVDFLSPQFRCWIFLTVGNTVTWPHWPGPLKLLATGMQQPKLNTHFTVWYVERTDTWTKAGTRSRTVLCRSSGKPREQGLSDCQKT